MLNLPLTLAKYKQTYLGKVGGPDGSPTVITCLRVGNEGDEIDVNLIMDVGDVRTMLYNTLRATNGLDPVTTKLYEAFKKVFLEESEAKAARLSTDQTGSV